VPSFFHTKKKGAATRVLAGASAISPAVSIVSHHLIQSSHSAGFMWYSRAGLGRGLVGSSLISKSNSGCRGGNFHMGPSGLNMSRYLWYSGGIIFHSVSSVADGIRSIANSLTSSGLSACKPVDPNP
jgi:hypothetical protein